MENDSYNKVGHFLLFVQLHNVSYPTTLEKRKFSGFLSGRGRRGIFPVYPPEKAAFLFIISAGATIYVR